MNINNFFENVNESGTFSPPLQELLDKLMAIKNPMDFTNEVATDEQLEALEDEMDRFEVLMPKMRTFSIALNKAKLAEADEQVFI